jgi:hypothetical protein
LRGDVRGRLASLRRFNDPDSEVSIAAQRREHQDVARGDVDTGPTSTINDTIDERSWRSLRPRFRR